MRKVKVKGHSVQKLEWTDGGDCIISRAITRSVNAFPENLVTEIPIIEHSSRGQARLVD